ncbi:MAG: HypC/HybG/HupF family hydrogenase formation chaperone [Lachnospiraceae bacterium]|nr:HypC/HybG/HupF family hydrogenase formation chaperone [Lachnospiraceae bacterium]
MCVALPGIVRKINDDGTAKVDFSGNFVNAITGLTKVKEGDSVLVHAGCIIQVVSQTEAEELNNLFKEIEDFV